MIENYKNGVGVQSVGLNLATLLNALPFMVVAVTRDRRVITFNRQAKIQFPALEENHPFERAIRSPLALSALDRVLTGKADSEERIEWREISPRERYFSIHIQRIFLAQTDISALVVIEDMTERRVLEKMRADFVANVSHELRTPLTALLGFIETLRGPARHDSDAREKFLEIMDNQTRRMARLIDDLLSLSRIERHAHIAPSTPVDLCALAEETIDYMRVLADKAGAVLRLDAQAPVVVAGDRDELARAIENLVGNALRYGGGEPVEAYVGVADGFGCFIVRDHGPGIAPHDLPRLTERFYRARAGAAEGGTGLGLALVKHIATRHRGRLTIESRLGQGATFGLLLPLIKNK